MKNQVFEKVITIENYQDINFLGSDGRKVEICKIQYSFKNEIGTCFKEINVPYEYINELKNGTYPRKAIVLFEVDDFTRKPKITGFKFGNN